MSKELLQTYADKYFSPIVTAITKQVNGKEGEPTYLHLTMLTPEYSPTGTFASVSANGKRVAADYVAMDSPLPLKARGRIEIASGRIPKMGLSLRLGEAEMDNVLKMAALKRPEAEVAKALFQDTATVITAIHEANEEAFLAGFSSGVAGVKDPERAGQIVRLDYGYPTKNKFGVAARWSDKATAKPLDDIRRVLKTAKQNGHRITDVYMDDTTLDQLLQSEQVRNWLFFKAGATALTGVGGSLVFGLDELNARLKADSMYRLTIHVIDRTVETEVNGKTKVITPWEAGKVIFTTTQQVGSLVYTDTVEAQMPADGVKYEKAGDYILVAQQHTADPVSEKTYSQARVIPVINNPERIYQLDATQLQG